MEGFHPAVDAFSADIAHHCGVHVLRRRLYVGRGRNVRKSVVDNRGYHDGRLCLHDRADHRLSAAVPHTLPLPSARTTAVFLRSVHRQRLPLHGIRFSAASGFPVVHQRLFQNRQHIRLLEQRTAENHTQTGFHRVFSLSVHLRAGQRAACQHSHRLQHYRLRLAGHASAHHRCFSRCVRTYLFRHAPSFCSLSASTEPPPYAIPISAWELSGNTICSTSSCCSDA